MFRALADPTRRAILESVADRAQPVHLIAERFDISRPAVSRHLKVLEEAGLLAHRREGKENLYGLEREALAEARAWLDRFWSSRLNTLKQLAERNT
ncbi:MAG: winged helix-turn-helix transcriptional regulator [Proteobacteria bacterium]|nr:winged helix-turn-helix transcriptional regulator [Pseudomonadota bacterium]